MEALTDHFKEYSRIYIIIACSLPFVYLLRRWVLPPILYAIEIAAYLTGMHVVIGGIIRFLVWFKEETQMDWADNLPKDSLSWTTPWLEFWNRKLYEPVGLFYFELAAALVIIFLVFKLRPMKTQKAKKKPTASQNSKRSSTTSVRPAKGGKR
jgi:hypothetical protein